MQRYNTLTPSIKKFELTGKAHHTVSWNMSRRNNEKLLIKCVGGWGWRHCLLSHRVRLREHPLWRTGHRYILPPLLLCGLWVWRLLIRTASGKERSRNTETDVPSMKDHRSCDNCIYYAMIDEECIVMLFVLITIMLGFSFIQYTNTWLSHQAFFINTRDIDI